MQIRRVVTGHDADGKSVFVDDAPAPQASSFAGLPGYGFAHVWSTAAGAGLPAQAEDPTLARSSVLPAPGGSSFVMTTFPPDSVMMSPGFDPVVAAGEAFAAMPGLIQTFEPDNIGMHTTDSIDYGIVLDGEIWLELDGGAIRHLKRGDVVIQNGTRHAWRNRSGAPATLAFFMVGAARG
jgi:hypothetical protein